MTDHDHAAWFQHALRHHAVELSPDGRTRRAEMRRGLERAVVRRRRRRRTLRGSAALLVAGTLAFLAWRVGAGRSPDQPATSSWLVAETVRDDPAVLRRYGKLTTGRARIVRDDDSVLQRCARAPAIAPETWIGDRELLRLLREAGRPAGLLRAPGIVILTADVVDDFTD